MVKRGTKRKNPHIKRQQRISRLKHPRKRVRSQKHQKRQYGCTIGDPLANTTKGTEKGQKDKMGIDDIGIFEFILWPTRTTRIRRHR